MKFVNTRRRQTGFTLVEAAAAMAIMGVAATLVVGAVGTASQTEIRQQDAELLDRGKAAVLSFIALNGRPPCPAADQSGMEGACGGQGFFPYKTVGLPDARAGELEYQVALALPGQFQVLMNQQPISAAENEFPTAETHAFAPLASSTYDGILDYCQALVPGEGPAPRVMTLQAPKRDKKTLIENLMIRDERPTRQLEAAEVSAHLNCAQLASLSGRSHFHAHLSSAVMNKAIQDFRTQFELGYGLYILDVGEGTWDFANALFDIARGWSQIMQHISAAAANIWSAPPKTAFEIAQSLVSAVNKTLTFVKAAAKASNLARYSVNMQWANENRELNNQLVEQAIELQATITDHARLSASSAFFLNEQTQAPSLGAAPGVITNSPPNAVFLEMRQTGRDRASGFNEPFGYADGMKRY
jgi:hypothetical protein